MRLISYFSAAEACSKVIKPDEEKRKEMTDLFRSHLVAEKEFQISEIANVRTYSWFQ